MVELPQNPDPNPGKDYSTVNLFGYVPSRYLSAPSVLLFALYALINFIFIFKRKWKGGRMFSFLMVIGSFVELLGYLARFFAYDKPFYTNWFVFSYCFIVCAPIFFSAAIYLAFYHLVLSHPSFRSFSILGPKLLVTLFTIFDVVTIVAQIGGAALTGTTTAAQSKGEKPVMSPQTANNILTIGLGIQNASFLFFLVIYVIFCFRASRAGKKVQGQLKPDKTLTVVIGTTAGLVFLRTVFRLVEAAEGFFSDLSVNEHVFGWLETFPVLLALGIWVIIPLGRRLHVQREAEEMLMVANSPNSITNSGFITTEHQRSNSGSTNSSTYKYGQPKRKEMKENGGPHQGGNGYSVYGNGGTYVGYV